MNKKKQHIDDLLKKAILDKAPQDFTANVMKGIDAISNEELLKDAKLTSLLQKTVVQQPSKDFTTNIMLQLDTQNKFNYKPLINKRSWFIIASSVIAIISFVLYQYSPSQTPSAALAKATPYLERIQSSWQGFIGSIEISSIFVLGLVAFTSLVLIDFISHEKSYGKTNL